MATQQEIIKRFMKALDTHKLNWSDKDFYKKILDDAIEYATSGSSRHFSTIAEAITAMKADIRSTNNANTFLKNYCGINLDNTDTEPQNLSSPKLKLPPISRELLSLSTV